MGNKIIANSQSERDVLAEEECSEPRKWYHVHVLFIFRTAFRDAVYLISFPARGQLRAKDHFYRVENVRVIAINNLQREQNFTYIDPLNQTFKNRK